jgi:solute carrier family 25 folate transporter 32
MRENDTAIGDPRTKLSWQLPKLVDASTVPLVAGFLAGVASTSLLLPLDVIKLRLQVSESSRPHMPYRSFRVFFGILKYEGVRGLYQGWTPAVVGSAVSWGGYFYFYEGLKKHVLEYKLQKQRNIAACSDLSHETVVLATLNSWDHFFLSCTAGAIMVAMTNPVWLVKTRMQLQMRKASVQHDIKPYRNTLDAFRTIIREEGYLALYKGSVPALLLTSHGGVQFVFYEYLRKQFHYNRFKGDQGEKLSIRHRLELSTGYLTIGAISKLAATTVTFPLQLIKARMQQRDKSVELTEDGQVRAVQRQYKGLVDTVKRIYTNEGVAGFFKGCIPNAVRVAPGAAVTFVVYEGVSDFLNE